MNGNWHAPLLFWAALYILANDPTTHVAASVILYFHTRTTVWQPHRFVVDTLQKCCTWIYGTWTPNPAVSVLEIWFSGIRFQWALPGVPNSGQLDTLYLSRANIESHPSGWLWTSLVKGLGTNVSVWQLSDDWCWPAIKQPRLLRFQLLTKFQHTPHRPMVGIYRSFGGKFSVWCNRSQIVRCNRVAEVCCKWFYWTNEFFD